MQFSPLRCASFGSSQMTEQGALQSTFLQFWVPQGKYSVFLWILTRSPKFSKTYFSPYLFKLMVFFFVTSMTDQWFQGRLSCISTFPNLHFPEKLSTIIFCSKSKSQMQFYICDQIHVFNFLSGSPHGTMSHSMKQGQCNLAMLQCWQVFPVGHIQFLLWQTYTLSPDSW